MQVIAGESLFLLWPDLDRLADSDNPDLAAHARETLECLAEDLAQPHSPIEVPHADLSIIAIEYRAH